jgi:hypothetical protein
VQNPRLINHDPFLLIFLYMLTDCKLMVKKPDLKMILAPLLLGAVMLVGFPLSPAYGQAQRFTFPLTGTLLSVPCTNDIVQVTSGYLQIVVQEFENEDGSKRLSVVASHLVGVTGVGQFSDIQYQIRSSGHETLVHNDGQEARTVTGTTNLFIEGGGVDSVSHATAHYTVSPSGQITVDFFNEAGGC